MKQGGGWIITSALWFAGLLAFFAANIWLAGGLMGLAVFWRFLLGPPSLDKMIRKGLTNFRDIGPEGWKALERKAARHYPGKSGRQLLYALRVASVVPTVTQLPTLASRYDVVMGGRNTTSGLLAVGNHPRLNEVKAFIEALFQRQLDQILGTTVQAYQAKARAAKTAATKEKHKAAALLKLRDWELLFYYPLPGLEESFSKHRAMIESGPQ